MLPDQLTACSSHKPISGNWDALDDNHACCCGYAILYQLLCNSSGLMHHLPPTASLHCRQCILPLPAAALAGLGVPQANGAQLSFLRASGHGTRLLLHIWVDVLAEAACKRKTGDGRGWA